MASKLGIQSRSGSKEDLYTLIIEVLGFKDVDTKNFRSLKSCGGLLFKFHLS